MRFFVEWIAGDGPLREDDGVGLVTVLPPSRRELAQGVAMGMGTALALGGDPLLVAARQQLSSIEGDGCPQRSGACLRVCRGGGRLQRRLELRPVRRNGIR